MEQTTWLRDLIYELWARQAMLETPGDTRLRLQAPWGDELQVERHHALRTVRVSYYLAKGKPARRRANREGSGSCVAGHAARQVGAH